MSPLIFLTLLIGATATEETPVAKVNRLLGDMKDRLAADQKTDSELYDQLSCWCQTNKDDKNSAVKMANDQITTLETSIDEYSAKSAELKATLARLQKDIAKSTDSLARATGIRDKEASEFNAEEAELLENSKSVGFAVGTLSKHHESFLQVTTASLDTVRHGVLSALKSEATKEVLAASQRKLVESFLQQPAGFNSYNSRSGEIFGLLKQMKETFDSNLSASQKDEASAQSEYAALKSAKTREIQAAKDQVLEKTTQLAETDEALAHAKHDLSRTRAALSADTKFLLDLNERCTNSDAEFAERTKMRNTEMAAVGEAISILTDDSSRDLFGATFNFAQTSRRTTRQQKAVAFLQAAAQKSGSEALYALALHAGLDAFTKVQEKIDTMIGALKKEMKDEVTHKDFCQDELYQNKQSQNGRTNRIADLTASIDDNTATVDTLTKEINKLQSEVAEMNTQIKRASEDRAAENKEFQQTIADQRATQTILQKVLTRLQKVYQKVETTEETPGSSFLQSKQTPGAAAPPPPAGFEGYSQDAGSGGVLSLIQEIIGEAKTLENEALSAEQDSQKGYEGFVADSSASIGAANRSIASKSDEKAELEGSLVSDKRDRKANSADLEKLGEYKGQLHLSCDYVLNNFAGRQEARGQEIDALGQAKAILTGADFSL